MRVPFADGGRCAAYGIALSQMYIEKRFKYRGKVFSIYGDLASGTMWVSLPVVAIFTLGWERTAVSRRTQTLLKRSSFRSPLFIKRRRFIVNSFKVRSRD